MTPYEQEMSRLADECMEDFRSTVLPPMREWIKKWRDFMEVEDLPNSVVNKIERAGEELESLLRLK